jgi:hypothetical protein
MTQLVEAAIFRLSRRSHPAIVLREVQTTAGVIDLLAVSFVDTTLATRTASGAAPVTHPRQVQALDAIPLGRPLRVDTVARRLRTSAEALQRSVLPPLISQGFLDLSHNRVRATGCWRPVGLELIAVELKLSKWKAAVRQADNAAWNVDGSWVVLDKAAGAAAANASAYFQAFGVGLAFLSGGGDLTVRLRPRSRRPVRWVRSWLAEVAWSTILATRRAPT